jgi:hypothetical protein
LKFESIEVSDGTMNIKLVPLAGEPTICGIEVVPAGGVTVAAPAKKRCLRTRNPIRSVAYSLQGKRISLIERSGTGVRTTGRTNRAASSVYIIVSGKAYRTAMGVW